MYDDDEFDDEESEVDPEEVRRDDAEVARGKDERAFYDGLAKAEDERHNAMRKDFAKRSLVAGEMRQKLRHKQQEIDAIAMKIQAEEDLIAFEQKKAYRSASMNPNISMSDVGEPATVVSTKDAREKEATAEFSVERALMHVKQLQGEKSALEVELREKLDALHEEERALSQLQHTLLRM